MGRSRKKFRSKTQQAAMGAFLFSVVFVVLIVFICWASMTPMGGPDKSDQTGVILSHLMTHISNK